MSTKERCSPLFCVSINGIDCLGMIKGEATPYCRLHREAPPKRGAFFDTCGILKGRENCHFSI